MDVGRFSGVDGAEAHASHQRISEYVRPVCEAYPGMGFTPREEWVVEQTVAALRTMLADTTCTDEERRTIEEFIELASKELRGLP